MSIYPAFDTTSNIFNPVDFDNTSDDTHDHDHDHDHNDYIDDTDLTNYLQKSGGTMTGDLTVPELHFSSDNTTQLSAFTTDKSEQIEINKNKSETNEQKLTNITHNNDITTIPKIETSEIIIQGQTSLAYTTQHLLDLITTQNRSVNNQTNISTNNNMISINSNDILQNQSDILQNQNDILQNQNNILQNQNDIINIKTKTDKLVDGTNSYQIQTNGKNMFIHSGSGYIQLYSNNVLIGNASGGLLSLNGEQQFNAYTDTDHNLVNTIPTLTSQINTNTNLINTNSTQISQIDNTLVHLAGQIHTPYITHIPLDTTDMLNIQSIPNGVATNITHNFNIGKALHDTYGLPNDFDYNGLYKTHKTFELCFTGNFTSNNSEVYNLQCGFRNIHYNTNVEHSSTSYMIDCGYSGNSGTSIREEIRFNTGMAYIVGSDALYGSHYLYLHTKFHIQSPLSGIVTIKGDLTVKCY